MLSLSRAAFAAGLLSLAAARISAQTPASIDSTRCDSVVNAARTDSIAAGLFVSVTRIDGGSLPPSRAEYIASTIATAFVPPRPFRLNVFSSGPARMRILRMVGRDTTEALRAPTLTGVYRLTANGGGGVVNVQTLRASLMSGFDVEAEAAIRAAGFVKDALVPPDGTDSMRVDVRFSTDSTRGARRMVSASFPRMPVVDAAPKRDNPPAVFPPEAKGEGLEQGEVVLRFVVDRSGSPVIETLEVVRASHISFVRAALAVLADQHFAPASIRGCAVSQVVDYPFSFVLPEH